MVCVVFLLGNKLLYAPNLLSTYVPSCTDHLVVLVGDGNVHYGEVWTRYISTSVYPTSDYR